MSDLTTLGLESLETTPELADRWGRCGLVCNQASVTALFKPAWKVLHAAIGERLVALFGPQHGFESTVQDNMIETGHSKHLPTGLPVYSLYSETRQPTAEMLEGIDTLVVDLQISGTRVYTYKYTMAACLRSAKQYNKKVVVLDRPNPLGGEVVEGNVLEANCHSFVGEFPIPMRHGLTIGELARYFNRQIGAELEVVPLSGWNPAYYWHQLGRSWVITSPNFPQPDCAYVFPGMVSFEGTNVSEGRGTTQPFLFIGAPFIKDAYRFVDQIHEVMPGDLGCHLRPTCFQPTFQKYAGQVCQGANIHVIKPEKIRSYKLGIAMLRTFISHYGDCFKWSEPPYEYNYEVLPIKLILGADWVCEALSKSDFSVDDQCWSQGIAGYIEDVQSVLLYQRTMTI